MSHTVVRKNENNSVLSCEYVGDEGKFVQSSPWKESSGVKKYAHGTYVTLDGTVTDALCVVFGRDQRASYAREVATLSQAQLMGVGPRLLCSFMPLPSGCLALVEEDVGISLEKAIAGNGIPYDDDSDHRVPLHHVGSAERVDEVRKILFDVFVQIFNLHERGIFHRDLRTANVCVRRFGDKPQELRATLVDFDLSVYGSAATIAYCNQPYLHLFEKMPRILGLRLGVTPTALEIDAAYLAAMGYELMTGQSIEVVASAADLADVQGRWPLFGYHAGQNPYFARVLNKKLDIDSLASELGLLPVNEDTFQDPAALAIARRIRHGGYVDACDLKQLRTNHPESVVYRSVEELSRQSYASYLAQVAENGLPIIYEDFEQQPSSLVESTKEQVRDIPNKVFALGLRIVNRDGRDPDELVEEFSPDEVEFLAFLEHERWCAERLADGWKRGAKKCVPKRISDSLVPYEELPESSKEYNRVHAREIPRLLAGIGLGIVRA